MEVRLHPEARQELASLDPRERKAMQNAMAKLEELEVHLGFPHASRVLGTDRIWELRPRAGRSRWRAFFRVQGGVAWVAAIGPESHVDRQGFRRAVKLAEWRLEELA